MTQDAVKQQEPEITPTRLQSWLFCGRQYKFQYLDKLEETPKKANTQGTIGHRLLEYEGDLWSGVGGAMDPRVLNRFDHIFWTALQEAKDNGLEITSDEELEMHTFLSETIYSFKKQAELRRMEIVQRETTLEYPFKGKIIEGTIDALVRFPDTPEGYVEIIDYKFGSRGQVEAQLNRNIQQGLYYLAARHNGFKVYRNWWIHMRHFQPYKRPPKGKTKGDLRGVGFLPIKITDEDVSTIYDLAGTIVDAIKADIYPANAYGEACKTCQYTDICPRFKVGTDIQEEWVV